MIDRTLIGLASDHAGFSMKECVKQYLDEHNFSYKDYGCYNDESCDYADFAHKLAEGIECGKCTCGIAMCGSGEGISMTLNKHQDIRAALVWQPEIAHMSRLHNDANVLVLPGRFMTEATARECLDEFFNTSFEGGRHQRRIEKMRVHP